LTIRLVFIVPFLYRDLNLILLSLGFAAHFAVGVQSTPPGFIPKKGLLSLSACRSAGFRPFDRIFPTVRFIPPPFYLGQFLKCAASNSVGFPSRRYNR
jgi:hypothetical protein